MPEGQGFVSIIFSRGICFENLNSLHLVLIISVFFSSHWLYYLTNSTAHLLVVRIGMLFSLEITKSLQNWFFGVSKCTVWPSKRRKKSFHAISSGDNFKSLNQIVWQSSKPTKVYFQMAGFTKHLKISYTWFSRKD